MIRIRALRKDSTNSCDGCAKKATQQIITHTMVRDDPVARAIDLCDQCAKRLESQFELPKDHWSVVDPAAFNVPPMPLRLGTDHPRHAELVEHLRAAARYAYRSATMNGMEPDLDPDALIQNLVVGLFGYWTSDGLSEEAFCNPSPIPPIAEAVPR